MIDGESTCYGMNIHHHPTDVLHHATDVRHHAIEIHHHATDIGLWPTQIWVSIPKKEEEELHHHLFSGSNVNAAPHQIKDVG